uniref:diacylglycerol O-acyltransferase n=1 Tax=Aegilops tauschii subsp. strangulata TaxID=200361 RepID=A0A453SD00_AEGTS
MSVDKNNIIHCAFCFADLVWFFLLRIELICFLKCILLKIHVESTLQGCAILIAFLVSAVFHELCIAVPCHIFKLWAFSGIMLQIPLLFLTKYLQDKFKNTMGGQHDILVLLQHSWATNVCSLVLPRCHEQTGSDKWLVLF